MSEEDTIDLEKLIEDTLSGLSVLDPLDEEDEHNTEMTIEEFHSQFLQDFEEWNIQNIDEIFAIPEAGDVRWNFNVDAVEIFNGDEWICILNAEDIRDIYNKKLQSIQRDKRPRLSLIIEEIDQGNVKKDEEITKDQIRQLIQEVIAECKSKFGPR